MVSIKENSEYLLYRIAADQVNESMWFEKGGLSEKFSFSVGFSKHPHLIFTRYFFIYLFRIVENFFVFLRSRHAFYMVFVWQGQELVGHLLGFVPSKVFRLNRDLDKVVEISYTTAPKYRNQGIATFLMKWATLRNAQIGFDTVGFVRVNNGPSRYVFEKFPVQTEEALCVKAWLFHRYYFLETDPDKQKELFRYDQAARKLLDKAPSSDVVEIGSNGMPEYLRSPYLFYEQKIDELVHASCKVLELGAGCGLNTWVLVRTGADVTASDISPNSLVLLKRRIFGAGGQVTTQVADMEALPFEDNAFDVIACAGCLSYGDPVLVNAEIRRVLRPGGLFVCVDSLNHHPIYRFNRWVHYLRGNRSLNTLKRMPGVDRIQAFSTFFSECEVRYFGALTFIFPLLYRLFGAQRTKNISDLFDQAIGVRKSAFRFVVVAKGLVK